MGKSELAKALAQELFDDEKHMVRVKGGRSRRDKARLECKTAVVRC